MLIHDTLILAAKDASLRGELRSIVETDYNVLEAIGEEQLRLFLQNNEAHIAAIIMDVDMESEDGTKTFASFYKEGITDELPVIAVISGDSPAAEKFALDKGAKELIYTPFHSAVVKHRVENIVSLFYNKKNLQTVVAEQADSIHNSYEVMVDTLSAIIEHRSVESGQHVLRIRRFTKRLLEEVYRSCPEYSLTKGSIQAIASASALHDIGKISIPDLILNKPGKLTEEEFEIMKTHTVTGSAILESFKSIGNEDYLRYAYNICRYHHERYDGGGYPEGLKGDEIPICAQVVGLVDAYDALTTDRVYKKAIPYLEASNMIINGECGAFSPKLIECFKHVRGSLEELARSYADGYSPKSDTITVPLPPPKKASPDSLQEAITKYRSLLHHFSVSAMEVDMHTGVFHVLYDPYLELAPMKKARSFEDAMERFANICVHPDDKKLITEDLPFYLNDFFSSGARKRSRHYRIKGSDGVYRACEATILRIAIESTDVKKSLLIWRRLGESETKALSSAPVLPSFASLITLSFDSSLTFLCDASQFFRSLGYGENKAVPSSLFDVIAKENVGKFTDELSKQLSESNRFETVVPVENGNGGISYCLFKGQCFCDSDGAEKLRGVICECDSSYRESQSHINDLLRYRNIIERTNDILFEWDVKRDVIDFSRNWNERFGYEPIRENASENIRKNSHMHPDDIDSFITRVKELSRVNSPFLEANVRIADSEGKYVWNRIRIIAHTKDDGKIEKYLGLITDIDGEMRRSEQLKAKAERDSLTKLYNKETARAKIDRLLMKNSQDKFGAFILIDLDNFKDVNDRFGHLFGDTLLSNVADAISGMFRESDVVARIGGDEFLVYMPEVSGKELIASRCNGLISVIRRLFDEMHTEMIVSCSVGVAVTPVDGIIYSDLFQKADIALYQAKKLGKGRCQFYDPKLTMSAYSAISKHIDSDERLGIADNSLSEYVFQRLYETSDVYSTVNSVLELIGKQLKVSRVYVFENNDENTACFNTFEWCAEGVDPEIHNLQNISYDTDIKGFRESFDERGLLYCTDIKELPDHIRAIVEPQGIRAMLHCAIRDNGVFKGYVGLDDCQRTRVWTKEQISLLSFLSQMISVFILKRRAQLRSDALLEDMKRIFENQFSWVYVVDPDTYTISFCNGRTLELVPDIKKDSICHKALLGKDTPCAECPINKGECGGTSFIRNDVLGLSVNSSASPIHWDGKKQWLITCNEVKE